MDNSSYSIILFDGVCNLCNGSVNFIIDHDKKNRFKFTSLQSETGQKLLETHNLNLELESIILIENEKTYQKSDAALQISKKLNFPVPMLYIAIIIPRFLRDHIYNYIAKNRYKWFGKSDSCRMPTPELKAKFI
ncbi:thiol-disulfide oxidoreductase DCC family protein [Chondrinema litorale]|uniref:thiol-disulfide oxidoreductase DCC family protein n=1 Tax=Chondrinema litorale TaxID=2994555 RepID=UPI002543006E|nr:thiol-disulfide oxidoreductase DCC family protein [Chondrinema litorale]UZR93334.1 thiol-disulfide oxidoreductase DCC family protein [Chondrinema litorale]